MLEIQDVHKSFGDQVVLKGVNLEVSPGELQVLIGLNGSGKTTLLKILTGLLTPDKGRVRIDGRDVTLFPPEERYIGYVPQHTALFNHLTVKENILYSLRHKRGSEETFHQMVDLLALDPYLERKPRELSGGYRSRVALARALTSMPRAMLLDEPITEVDRAKKEHILPLFRRVLVKMNIPVLYITHDPWEAEQIGTSFSIMKEGSVTRINSPAEAFAIVREQALCDEE
ncbi:MAG: Molybdate/tungstate import ATP-binding protein WtpC [Methanoregulaceae archaeon PtaB.Bin009]|jgi:molybdate transport system ATP-binding protein|nr:MAG: Molybdate/tungstate import ATP-binding protein WtpC [Methanoregulaceae archaeon PtaB.Bin009]OPY42117.1 MAG: Molybdate/tungstate import ATP-binding protein WtpC [Methanoregulaceae archaeon PtaU1.Bin066]HNQ29063.1 ABC transporter ATP-binding protein [Methanolinea sp.]